MSRISNVIANRNKAERVRRERRTEELRAMKSSSSFKARLYEELSKVNILLESNEIDAVVIEIPDRFIANFGESLYSSDLAEYNIEQLENEPNKFYVRKKFVSF